MELRFSIVLRIFLGSNRRKLDKKEEAERLLKWRGNVEFYFIAIDVVEYVLLILYSYPCRNEVN